MENLRPATMEDRMAILQQLKDSGADLETHPLTMDRSKHGCTNDLQGDIDKWNRRKPFSAHNSAAQNIFINLCCFALLVALVLKLTGCVGWSWWLVTAPLWGCAIMCAAIDITETMFPTNYRMLAKRDARR